MTMKNWQAGLLAAGFIALTASGAGAQTLRVGLQEDPDLLDPDLARSFVGRIVFTSLCDKLVDLGPDLDFVPQLATEWSWSPDNKALTLKLRQGVTFHDGEPFNAEAVKFNIERSLTLPGSTRRSEIAAVTSVDVVDPYTVRLNLSEPFAPLLAALSDRAGMMISPKAAREAGENFSRAPVCSGPYKFVERVAQDRIVLEKFPQHWNASAYPLERVSYLPIPDTTVRLANLQSGGLDIIERTAPADLPTVRGDSSLRLEQATSLGYQGITLNVGNGPRAEQPLGKDPKVREAFELAIDRTIVNQVGFEGEHTVGNQPVAPTNPYYAKSVPVPERDVERAKKLLEEAGHGRVKVELMTPNAPDSLRVAEVIQALAGEAGFDVSVNATEFATGLDRQTRGDFEAFLIGWSGRADPDGNIHIFVSCKGGLNDGKYCNPKVDEHLNAARTTTDAEARKAEYAKAAELYLADRQRIYMYHQNWFWAMTAALEGFKPHPDGMIRLEGVSLKK
ncbi:ABC transporter substrate-binding protein [Skermanella sp. TT6]|nr:ABC transporter substrate-binding protein [Skermanella sp. TT6]